MSHQYINNSRNGCALHGALSLVDSIDGAVPVIHATAGCGRHFVALSEQSGAARVVKTPLASTNIAEKHVVFGGGARLREELKNSVKIVNGDLITVITGCATEMVGDDIPAMTKEGVEQGFPVIYANTPGFKGSAHVGYETLIKSLVTQWAKPQEKQQIVNILGIIPGQSPFWYGDLSRITDILAKAGFTVNPLVGPDSSVDSWNALSAASFTIVLSQWGKSGAKLLEERFGIPFVETSGVPIGPEGVSNFYRSIAEVAGITNEWIDERFEKQEKKFAKELASISRSVQREGFQRSFAVVGESWQAPSIARFLAGYVGAIPKLIVITDPTVPSQQEEFREKFADLTDRWNTEILFSEDSYDIEQKISELNVQFILGSIFETDIADSLGIPSLQISSPASNRFIINRSYAGVCGALNLLEDIGTELRTFNGNQ